MKLFLTVGLVLFCAAGPALAGERSLLARVTVYWRGEGSGERAAWNGVRLRDGHCAVDPKKIPFGSKVVFPDLACLAVDSGPAVISRKAARACARTIEQRAALVIDRFFDTRQQAQSWERSHPHFMTVRVLTRDRSTTSEFRPPLVQKSTVMETICNWRALVEPDWISPFARILASAVQGRS